MKQKSKRGVIMNQHFIELGEGLTDIYELLELADKMPDRILRYMAFHTNKSNEHLTSIVIIMQPTKRGNFQPLYICLEGIQNPHKKQNKRYDLFHQSAERNNHSIIELTVKPSIAFNEKTIYFQYLLGILRMNRYIPGTI